MGIGEFLPFFLSKNKGKNIETNLKSEIQSVNNALIAVDQKKVDKVTGKALSTEDFSTALKLKLSSLYSKTELDLKFQISDEFKVEVDNYSDLATAYTPQVSGDIAFVRQGSGTFLLNRKPSGVYRYNGSAWELSNDYGLLINEIKKKVDKDGNKVLSDNNYTDEDKNKITKSVYTKVEADNLLKTKSDTNHTHSQYEPTITKNSGFNRVKADSVTDGDINKVSSAYVTKILNDKINTKANITEIYGKAYLNNKLNEKLSIVDANNRFTKTTYDTSAGFYFLHGHGFAMYWHNDNKMMLRTLSGAKSIKCDITSGKTNSLGTTLLTYTALTTSWVYPVTVDKTQVNTTSITITNFTDKKIIELTIVTDGKGNAFTTHSSVRSFPETPKSESISKDITISSNVTTDIGTVGGVKFYVNMLADSLSEVRLQTDKSIQWSGGMHHYKGSWLNDIIQTQSGSFAIIGYKHGSTTLYSYGDVNGWDSDTNKTYRVLWSSGGSTLKIKIAYTGEI